jgi:hypothetical protein
VRKNPLADESLPLADVNGHHDHPILSGAPLHQPVL